MVEFEKVLATAVEQKKILIVEGKVDFDTADADVIDCAKWKVLDILVSRITLEKNSYYEAVKTVFYLAPVVKRYRF